MHNRMTLQIQSQDPFSRFPIFAALRAVNGLFHCPACLWCRQVFALAMLLLLAAVRPSSAQEADLVALDVTFSPQSINAGAHPTSVTYSYGNAGPDDIELDSVVSELFLSRNSIFGDADDIRIWQSEQFFNFFAAGDALTFTLNSASLAQITIPADASGSYYVFVLVDHTASSSYFDPDLSDNHISRSGTITVNPPPRPLLIGTLTSQGFQLTVNGTAGRSYRFDGSADLKTWNQLATVVADPAGTAQYLDTAATTLDHRFYRAALLSP